MPLVVLVIPVLLAADLGSALPAGTLPDDRDPIAPLLAGSPAGERFAHEQDVQPRSDQADGWPLRGRRS